MIPAVPMELTDAALARRRGDGLALVEDGLREAARAEHDLLAEASAHLIEAAASGSGRLLVLLAAQFGDPRDPRVVPAAVAVELTHLATLYHDDVMDEADLRRGAPSANSRWDNSVAILTGDFLFARASLILADLGPDAVRIQAETFAPAGDRPDRRDRRPAARARTRSSTTCGVVTEKTASLIATAGPVRRDVLRRAGRAWRRGSRRPARRIGVAFQLSDDILDVASESAQSGKTPGTDLREGVPTLPMLHALRSAGPGDARLVELLSMRRARPIPHLHAEALALLRAHPAMEMATRRHPALGRAGHATTSCAARRPRQGRVRGALRVRGRADGLTGRPAMKGSSWCR